MTIVVRTIARLTIPFMFLFGLCVIIHGHASPGGGFQGGVIIGASMIFYAIVFGMSEAKKTVADKYKFVAESVGIIIFGLVGIACILLGGAFLEYFVIPLPHEPRIVSEIMISVIEVAIGITVMGIHISIFYFMTGEAE